MLDFTQITDKLPYPPKLKGKLSTYHSDIISYTLGCYQDNKNFKLEVIQAMNTISYLMIKGDTLPIISPDNPLSNLPKIDTDELESVLGALLISFADVKWDIEESEIVPKTVVIKDSTMHSSSVKLTSKEDLYIRPPVVPLFDFNKPWLNMVKNGIQYTIYTTLPIIPENQRDISITTNVNLMSKTNLLNLYPNQFIKTRAACMYEVNENMEFDSMLGIIIPIKGFSSEQIKNNIIQYPHFYKLKRKVNDKFVSFYSNIEIDGILYNTLDIWDSLPESKMIPKTTEFIKEYVIRRYLLERDELHIEHRYPLFGSLDPYLTLFTTASDYQKLGISDIEELAKKCVSARVQYLQSRNPILRTVYDLP